MTHLVHLAFNISRISRFSHAAQKLLAALDLMIDQTLFSSSAILLAFSAFSFLSSFHIGEDVLFEIFSYKMVQVGSKTKVYHWEIFLYLKHLLRVAKTNARFSIDLDCQN